MMDGTHASSKPSRRSFLAGGGALIFVIAADGQLSAQTVADDMPMPAPNIWLQIRPSGAVHITYPNTEMGQGSSSALPAILADELDADWDDVVVEQLSDNDLRYGDSRFGEPLLYTAGSGTVIAYMTKMRLAGAQARKTMIAAAAAHWSVPAERLRTEPGRVIDPETGQSLPYGDIAANWTGTIAIPDVTETDLKDPATFRYIGKDFARHDVFAKSTGQATYAIDVRLPDMVYAAVLRAPVEGETVLSIDDADARAMPGVIDIVPLPDGIAVVATHIENALIARDMLSVAWTETSPFRTADSEADLQSYLTAAMDPATATIPFRAAGDAPAAIDAAPRQLERTYLSDYAYHAQMEPMAVVASVDDDGKGADVWAGTQTQTLTTKTIMAVLGTSQDRVRLNMMTMGGSFGRRVELMQNYVRDALLASKAVGKPVKVIWTREDDLKFGAFRPIAAQVMRAGLTENGQVTGWHHRVATPSVIEYFNPERWEAAAPRDGISVSGSQNPYYGIPDFLSEHVKTERRARIMPWRATASSYTLFAAESFVDELAADAGRDVVDFRRDLLAQNPSGSAMLERVLEMSDWDRPRTDTALGLGLGLHFSSHGLAAVEVSVDRDSGAISVHNIWGAFDPGLVVSPQNALAQIEGGLMFGVSCALKEELVIKNGEVEQNNYYDYEILRADQAPNIELELMPTGDKPGGIGELSTGMVPAAIANAMFRLTGRRLRHLPFTPARVKAALA
ncbi:molybdopterin cofactor-binding domain-containing protein [Yoonia sp. SS1-5]|uniref:Molybdopterin cofactor-binding domain-containing protein n=1 Tax=Yoonia rhodophyticola TaxID=3137370 RepID=A0AAN0MA80_9RHOB